ncbi:MAG: gamma-glutamyltransferase [Frankiales bacterium]|nr:gamma-glutamyltransferase [Frankiales bacterium]
MFTTRPELQGTHGMVASTHWLASAAGMSVLERGGNAVDAAVAAGFVLQVVEPHLNGPGGDVPVLVAAPGRDVEVYCGQGPTPAAASIERYRDLGLDLVPGTGLLAAVVPGAFGAWTLLLEQRGTWRLRDVLEPAIGYAADGFPLLSDTAATIGRVQELFRDEWPTSAATWLTDGGVPAAGTRFRNPVLAQTYRRIVQEAEAAASGREEQLAAARDVFYRGFVAEALDTWCRTQELMDTSGRRHGGLLTGDDLAQWQPTVEQPVSLDYGGLTIHKTGAWGQGPVLLQWLQLLSGYDLAGMGHLSVDWVHTVVETGKLAFADREAWYGDPAHVNVPLEVLLSPEYADARRALVGDHASYDLLPGSPDGRIPRLPTIGSGVVAAAGAGEPTVQRDGATRGDTCHVDVVDRDGMMVSATPSGGWLQSSPTVPELGFCLGSRAQMLWLEPGLPSSMAGGKRPRTTLTPSLATRDGVPHLAFGTPGGDQQDQWQIGFLLAHLHAGLGLQAAIDAPAFHSDHAPSSFYPRQAAPGRLVVETRLPAEVLVGLRERGHDVQPAGDWTLGRLSAVGRDPQTGFLKAAANPRGMQGYAVGR